MKQFNNLLNWRLLSGSHRFPGPDGGTCINEAAIVVAGFPYQAIRNADDCPLCFSRPISAYAIGLNDRMPDDLRCLLLPFVTRLAGTADTPSVESCRAGVIAIRTVHRILSIMLRSLGEHGLAAECEQATTVHEARETARRVRNLCDGYAADAAAIAAHSTTFVTDAATTTSTAAAYAAEAANAAEAAKVTYAANAATAAAQAAAQAAAATANAATAAVIAAHSTAYAADAAAYTARKQIWQAAVEILDAALSIGRQAEPIEAALVIERAEAAKRVVLQREDAK